MSLKKLSNQDNLGIPSHIFVGDESHAQQIILEKIQREFCKQKEFYAGCFCNECRKIKGKHHQSVIWIEPKKSYLLSDISIIFEKIRFSLDTGKKFFFVITKAHNLTPVCANKLLKTLEEPPPGYVFFLLANNEETILPTIRSRSYIHHIQSEQDSFFHHPLLKFFVDPQANDPFALDQELRKQKPTEQEVVELVHQIIISLKNQIKNFYKNCVNNQDIKKLEQEKKYNSICLKIEILHEQLKKPPQAGSATLFCKKLFLELT
jgi:hypothetical protein